MELAGHGVEPVLDDREAHGADVEVGAFGQPASQQADASMFVKWWLVGAVGVGGAGGRCSV